MKQQLTASQTQQLALTPQLRQALAVLQMSSAELEIEIANAVESNPLLDWSEDARPLELSDGGTRDDPSEGPTASTDSSDRNPLMSHIRLTFGSMYLVIGPPWTGFIKFTHRSDSCVSATARLPPPPRVQYLRRS